MSASTWDVEAVCAWLGRLDGVGEEVIATFRGEGVNGPALLEMTAEELKDELGVKFGARKAILRGVGVLQHAEVEVAMEPEPEQVEPAGSPLPQVPATPSAKPQQGGRVAAGLSALAGPPVAPLAAILKPLVEAPRIGFVQVRARDLRTNCAACATSPAGLRTGCAPVGPHVYFHLHRLSKPSRMQVLSRT
jgi:hypothetical protein